mgnify:CR=1 FL=1
MDDTTDPLAELAREHLLRKRAEARKKKRQKDAARSAAKVAAKLEKEPTLCDKLREYRAEVDDVAAAEAQLLVAPGGIAGRCDHVHHRRGPRGGCGGRVRRRARRLYRKRCARS